MQRGSVVLWEEEGTGAFNSWRERLYLTARANGALVISVTRQSIDEVCGLGRVYRSRPFKKLPRLLEEIGNAAAESGRPGYTTSEMIRLLSRIIPVDAQLAGAALRLYAKELALPEERQVDLLRD
jgi:hypothetical protein